jgi:hypothetical protein
VNYIISSEGQFCRSSTDCGATRAFPISGCMPCTLLDLDDGARVEPDDEHADEEAEHPEDSRARAVDLVSFSCAQTPLSIVAHPPGCVIPLSMVAHLRPATASPPRPDRRRCVDARSGSEAAEAPPCSPWARGLLSLGCWRRSLLQQRRRRRHGRDG